MGELTAATERYRLLSAAGNENSGKKTRYNSVTSDRNRSGAGGNDAGAAAAAAAAAAACENRRFSFVASDLRR